MDAATRRRLQGLVGLGVRGRLAVIGVEQVRAAALRDKLALVLVAPDASPNSLEKVVPLLRARRIQYVEVLSAVELGAAAGRETTAAVGIVDRQLARGIRAIVESPATDVRDSGADGAP